MSDKIPNQTTSEHILWDELQAYTAGGRYPMHMPGHKRQITPAPGLPADWDLTEVPGVDDLHHAEGILQEAMQRTAELFGARRTWYLVNGSTVGLLSSIRAVCGFGSEVIIARNCHKAVYHAAELLHLDVHWVYPEWMPTYGIYGSVRPEAIEEALAVYPQSKAVILTSPTYEGVVSDIRSISGICHNRPKQIPLIVDEAHGAHLGLYPEAGFPDSAVHLGADLIIQSAHKTLPSLTQTAFLHLGKETVMEDVTAIERELDVFETSSPSYPLLASLDGCTGILRSRGRELFQRWRAALQAFDLQTAGLQCLRILRHGAERALDNTPDGTALYAFDSSKILVSGNGICTGAELAERLRKDYRIETEMHLGSNVLAMTTCGDDREGILQLAGALCDLDQNLAQERLLDGQRTHTVTLTAPVKGSAASSAVMRIAKALASPRTETPMENAEGCICGEYIYCYPPGIPVMVPGERITRDEQERILYDMEQGCRIFHSHTSQYAEPGTDPWKQTITVVQNMES